MVETCSPIQAYSPSARNTNGVPGPTSSASDVGEHDTLMVSDTSSDRESAEIDQLEVPCEHDGRPMTSTILRMFQDTIIGLVDTHEFERHRANDSRRTPSSLVILLRGMPGSGLSTFAQFVKIYAEGKGMETLVCCANDFFQTPDRGYVFDYGLLKDAHVYSQRRFRYGLRDGIPIVVVDNTNIRRDEWAPYLDIARVEDPRATIHRVNFLCPTVDDASRLRNRDPSKYPASKVFERYQSYEEHDDAFHERVEGWPLTFDHEPVDRHAVPLFDGLETENASAYLRRTPSLHPIQRMFWPAIGEMVDRFMSYKSAIRTSPIHNGYPIADPTLVVILRGLPGCGKSTFAALVKMYASAFEQETVICSPDDYFVTDRGFQFDANKLSSAEARCQFYFQGAIHRRVPIVVVDKENLTEDSWRWYTSCLRGSDDWLYHVNFTCNAYRDEEHLTYEAGSFVDAQEVAHRSFHPTPSPENLGIAVVKHHFGTAAFMGVVTTMPPRGHAPQVERVAIDVDPIVNTWDGGVYGFSAESNRTMPRQ